MVPVSNRLVVSKEISPHEAISCVFDTAEIDGEIVKVTYPLLSIPKISKPFFEKNSDASEPTNPQEPVIKTTAIDLNIFFCYLLSIKMKFLTHLSLQKAVLLFLIIVFIIILILSLVL